jgi:hypothetical protein
VLSLRGNQQEDIPHQEKSSAVGQLKPVLNFDLQYVLLVSKVACDAWLQGQFWMGVHYHPRLPSTHLQPFVHLLLSLEVPFMPLQLLEAALALVLDKDEGVVAEPCFRLLPLRKRLGASTKRYMFLNAILYF